MLGCRLPAAPLTPALPLKGTVAKVLLMTPSYFDRLSMRPFFQWLVLILSFLIPSLSRDEGEGKPPFATIPQGGRERRRAE